MPLAMNARVRDRIRRLAAAERRTAPTRDALAAPVVLAVLAVLEECSVRELDFHLSYYSPGEARLTAILAALVGTGELRASKRVETVDGCPFAVPVFSLSRKERTPDALASLA